MRVLSSLCLAVLPCASALSIVTFKAGADIAAHHKAVRTTGGVAVEHHYSIGAFQGYSAEFSDAAVKAVLARPEVASIEEDQSYSLKRSAADCTVQQNAPSWGLQRISATKLPLEGTYSYPSGAGADVDVWVLDTGVRITHKEFQGRASFEYNAAKGKIDTDTDGHGTFVAGVAAAEHYGVCKQCNVRSVKIFTDTGDSTAAIILAGFDYVANHFNKGKKGKKGHVINISVGGSPGQTSNALDSAVNELVALGVHVVSAAGNENVDACTESPGRATGAINVGSSMRLLSTPPVDYFLGGSNFGKCVKMFGPGDKIVSLGISSDDDVGLVDSGTSFASPHVAGVLAELVGMAPANATLADVQKELLDNALSGVISGVPGNTPNLLVHNGCN